MDSNSPCKDLLFPRGPNLAQKPLYLVGTVLKASKYMILAQNLPKTVKSSWQCPFKDPEALFSLNRIRLKNCSSLRSYLLLIGCVHRELLWISSNGDDPRIFLGFAIFDSRILGYGNLASSFLGSLIWVGIFSGIKKNRYCPASGCIVLRIEKIIWSLKHDSATKVSEDRNYAFPN